MYIAACDDCAEDMDALITLLEQWQLERQTSLRFRSFHSASALLDSAEREPFTLYLLDIMIPGVSGMSAAKELRALQSDADIVFLTSTPGFAYESYSVHALDYLLKPIKAPELFSILDRLSQQERQPQEGLTLKSGAALLRVPFQQLAFVEVTGRRLHFNLTDGSVYDISGTLSEYEPLLLNRTEFVRPHRAYIVNLFQIASLTPKEIRTFSGKALPVSRLLYPQLQKDYLQLLFSKEGDDLS